ncbi:hypothetical protein [Streptomyces tricolor]|uniref:hypothetical protein n=1 Tax=Streptomyces tricolor TaxID=68277 RepID=UPI0036E4557C
MPADEVTRGTDVDGPRARTGPRHAAPRKPLFTRFHMPAGKAIASVAMPTAVLMGMGFTSTLALADNNGSPSPSTSAKSLTADEYKDCVKALDDDKDASASPSPSASQSASASPSQTAGSGKTQESGRTSSPDSGSGDKATPEPAGNSGSGSGGSDGSGSSGSSGSGTGSSGSDSDSGSSGSGSGSGGDTPTPTQTQGGGNVLDTIGDTLGDLLTGGAGKDTDADADSGTSPQTATPTPSASSSTGTSSGGGKESGTSGTVEGTARKATDTVKDVKDTARDTTGTGSGAGEDAARTAGDATASATPSPSASESASAEDCPVATDDEGGVDNKVPVADDPWYLNASSLLLKGADYQGIVEVRTANGTTKKVLKYVISGGTDIGDLHQTVKDEQAGKTYHVQAAKGSTSTIRGGDTVMYTESISGNLFGLIPVTFSPDSPPPLNIPLIYFTDVKVTQAAQFGGNLHVPGMHVYTTD